MYTAATKEPKMPGVSELLSARKHPLHSKGSRATPYKLFLADDELAFRESIRDTLNWPEAGFELCGEAPNADVALPLIQSAQPDVLITDIKKPFSGGPQLIQVVRQTLPDIKIIILSRQGEFDSVQEAIRLGITEYLLKPITPEKLTAVLHRVAAQLDEERQARENRQGLKNLPEDSLAILREKFLLKVVLGDIPPAEIVEKGHRLKL